MMMSHFWSFYEFDSAMSDLIGTYWDFFIFHDEYDDNDEWDE